MLIEVRWTRIAGQESIMDAADAAIVTCGADAGASGKKAPFEGGRALFREMRSHLRPWRGGLRDAPGMIMPAAVALRWELRARSRAHSLPLPLVVSLTSYPRRFPTLALTLKCLLSQSIAPDCVVLWIARDDYGDLPRTVLDLRREGLEIEVTRDLGSFKKLVPALHCWPDACVVSADDDVYYPRTWLSELVGGYRPNGNEVAALRVHRIMLDTNGSPKPYLKWAFDVAAGPALPLNMATGVGGILYPPGSLHPDVLNEGLFRRLCPTNDDLWFYFMERRAGSLVRKVGPRRPYVSWAGSQRVALQHANVVTGGQSDDQMMRLIDHFGSPFQEAASARRSGNQSSRIRSLRYA